MTYVTVNCAHCNKSIKKELRYYNYNFVKRGKRMFCDVVCAGRASQINGRTEAQREMTRMYFKEWHRKKKLFSLAKNITSVEGQTALELMNLELPKGGL